MLRLARAMPDDCGSTVVDYALIAALISVLIIGACVTIGQDMFNNFYGPIAGAL